MNLKILFGKVSGMERKYRKRREKANNIVIFGMKDDDNHKGLLATITSTFESINLDSPKVGCLH